MAGRSGRPRTAIRVVIALVAVGCFLAAATYAATRPAAEPRAMTAKAKGRAGVSLPPRSRIAKHPAKLSTAATAGFSFTAAGPNLRFRCRLDADRWRGCRSPATYTGLATGDHSFSVRAVRRGRPGAAATFAWKLIEPRPFAIEAKLDGIGALYPGATPVLLPVLLNNPNPVPILVTAVRVSVTASPPGCDGATNLELTPAGVSAAAPLALPAGGSASLPSPSVKAPAIALRNLPVNQDACQGGRFALAFSGDAHG